MEKTQKTVADTKGKAKLSESEYDDEKQVVDDDEAFFSGLISEGVSAAAVKKLKRAKLNTCDTLLKYCQENLVIEDIKAAKVYAICKAALNLKRAGKITGTDLSLRDTAYLKKQPFVYVYSLPSSVNEDMRRKKFQCYGHVEEVLIPTRRRTYSYYGFVYFETREQAEAALEMDQTFLGDKKIHVKMGDMDATNAKGSRFHPYGK